VPGLPRTFAPGGILRFTDIDRTRRATDDPVRDPEYIIDLTVPAYCNALIRRGVSAYGNSASTKLEVLPVVIQRRVRPTLQSR
jgi:hypothetical protein